MQHLLASDVGIVSLLRCLIHGGRESRFVNDVDVPLRILCYLGESIKMPRSRQYTDLSEFIDDVWSYLQEGAAMSEACRAYVNSALKCEDIVSVDSLVDFVDTLRLLFQIYTESPNRICAPTRVVTDSMLGYYLRTFLVRWECMSFESVCSLYESVERFKSPTDLTAVVDAYSDIDIPTYLIDQQHSCFDSNNAEVANKNLALSMGTDDNLMHIATCASSLLSNRKITPTLELPPSSFYLNAEKALACDDLLPAEESLHKFFDSGNTPLGLSSTSAASYSSVLNTSVQTNGPSPAVAMDALLSSITEPLFAGARHQQAMLALANMFQRGSRYSLAMSAIEEAMKTAHQRGDHAAVAKALLLLHIVVDEGGVDGDGLPLSAEEVLGRCLERCASLKLRSLSSQAVLHMVELRIRGPLRPNASILERTGDKEESGGAAAGFPAGDDGGAGGGGDAPISQGVQNLWMLLSSSLLGDPKLSATIALEADQKKEFRAGGGNSSTNMNKDGAGAGSSTEFPMTAAEVSVYAARVAMSSMCLWNRLGCHAMAELQGRRALRQLGSFASSSELIEVCCKTAFFQIVLAASASSSAKLFLKGDECSARKLRLGCLAAKELVRKVQEQYPSRFPAKHSNQIQSVLLLASTYEAVADCKWDKALRLALRLLDCTASSNPSSSSVSQFYSSKSYEHAHARLLHAQIMAHFDPSEAIASLLQVEAAAKARGSVQGVLDAMALRSQLTMQQHSSSSSADVKSLSLSLEVLYLAQELHVPSARDIIAHCVQ